MNEVIEFLNKFFETEAEAIKASDVPDIETFNNKLEEMNKFLEKDVQNKLGLIPLNELKSEDYYNRVKNFPVPDPRFLFRIDTYDNKNHGKLYCCFVSDSNPDDWQAYLNLLVVSKIEGEFKVISVFFFSNKGGLDEKKWHFNAGNEEFMERIDGHYILNNNSLGERKEIKRLLEPSDDQDSMKEYNKD